MAEMFRIDKRYREVELGADYPTPTKANALDLSIAKWQFIVNHLEDNPGAHVIRDGAANTCGCCLVFVEDDCADCPISKAGHGACAGTWYMEYDNAYGANDYAAALDAAKCELAFLQGLKDA